jgi:transposase
MAWIATRRTTVTYYAGLDVSLREISVCVIDEDGTIITRATIPADPMAVDGWFKNQKLSPKIIVHENGQLSIWLQRGFQELGLPAVCIDARRAHKSLSARINKSDASDAEGLAQLARTGWFSALKSWAIRLAGRKGFRKAAIATAQKIAVFMLTLWKNGTDFTPKIEAKT